MTATIATVATVANLKSMFTTADRVLGDVDYEDFRAGVLMALEGRAERAMETARWRVARAVAGTSDDMVEAAGLDAAQSGVPAILAVYAVEVIRGDVKAYNEFFEAACNVAALSAAVAFVARQPPGGELTEEILTEAMVEASLARNTEQDAQGVSEGN